MKPHQFLSLRNAKKNLINQLFSAKKSSDFNKPISGEISAYPALDAPICYKPLVDLDQGTIHIYILGIKKDDLTNYKLKNERGEALDSVTTTNLSLFEENNSDVVEFLDRIEIENGGQSEYTIFPSSPSNPSIIDPYFQNQLEEFKKKWRNVLKLSFNSGQADATLTVVAERELTDGNTFTGEFQQKIYYIINLTINLDIKVTLGHLEDGDLVKTELPDPDSENEPLITIPDEDFDYLNIQIVNSQSGVFYQLFKHKDNLSDTKEEVDARSKEHSGKGGPLDFELLSIPEQTDENEEWWIRAQRRKLSISKPLEEEWLETKIKIDFKFDLNRGFRLKALDRLRIPYGTVPKISLPITYQGYTYKLYALPLHANLFGDLETPPPQYDAERSLLREVDFPAIFGSETNGEANNAADLEKHLLYEFSNRTPDASGPARNVVKEDCLLAVQLEKKEPDNSSVHWLKSGIVGLVLPKRNNIVIKPTKINGKPRIRLVGTQVGVVYEVWMNNNGRWSPLKVKSEDGSEIMVPAILGGAKNLGRIEQAEGLLEGKRIGMQIYGSKDNPSLTNFPGHVFRVFKAEDIDTNFRDKLNTNLVEFLLDDVPENQVLVVAIKPYTKKAALLPESLIPQEMWESIS